MSRHDDIVYIRHIHQAADKIAQHLRDVSLAAFQSDDYYKMA